MTKKMQNTERFPFDDIEVIPAPRPNPFRHGWLKFVERQPPIVYRGEYQLLANLFERRGADLMHIYFGHTGVHLLPFIQCWAKPCIVSFHGADVMLKAESPEYAAKLKKVFQSVPLVLARSRSLSSRLIRWGVRRKRSGSTAPGFRLAQFPVRRREAPVDGQWKFLQACRLIPKKGLTTCCAPSLFSTGRIRAPNCSARGRGRSSRCSRRWRSQLGVSEHVHFTGFLSQKDLVDLYQSSHVFLHPSEMPADENQEGIPNSILEAMATGMPVLATLHGGIPEAVEEDAAGRWSTSAITRRLPRR